MLWRSMLFQLILRMELDHKYEIAQALLTLTLLASVHFIGNTHTHKHTDKWFLRDRICISRMTMTMLNTLFSWNFLLLCWTTNYGWRKWWATKKKNEKKNKNEKWLLAMDKWQIFTIRRKRAVWMTTYFVSKIRIDFGWVCRLHTKLLNWLPFLSHFAFVYEKRIRYAMPYSVYRIRHWTVCCSLWFLHHSMVD